MTSDAGMELLRAVLQEPPAPPPLPPPAEPPQMGAEKVAAEGESDQDGGEEELKQVELPELPSTITKQAKGRLSQFSRHAICFNPFYPSASKSFPRCMSSTPHRFEYLRFSVRLEKMSRKFTWADYGTIDVARMAAISFQKLAAGLEVDFEIRKGADPCLHGRELHGCLRLEKSGSMTVACS